MEEAGGPMARAKARVVSATLTWRQRPPAQEEIKHGFHKVSLVSGAQMEAPQKEMFEFSRREEVNGFATQEEETVNCQGPRDTAGSKNFQSHGPIFSKKFTPPPKEKRPEQRLKEAVDQSDGSRQDPRTEPPRVGAMARTELLVPLPGPREPSPHPGVGLTSGSSRSLEEHRVTRTVRTTTVVRGHVDRRVSSSVTVRPMSSGEALPRGRQVARMVQPVVVGSPPGSPSRSQAVKVLSNLVPAGHSPSASHLPRPTAGVPRSTGLGSTVGAALRQLPETGTAELKDSSALVSTGIPASAHLPKNQDVPAACPDRDQGRALDARACELWQVLGAPSSTELPLQTSQGQASVPSSPRLQTHVPSPSLAHPAKQPVVPTHARAQLTPLVLPPIKREGLVDPPAATVLPMVRREHVTVPEQPPAPSSIRRKDVPSPGGLSAPSSPRNKFVQNSPALKTQGKPNTRPGKVIFFSESGCQGSGREVWGDIVDASGWAPVASIRVVRGCWVLYEEPEFRGQKLVLPEGDMELRTPGTKWSPQGIGSLRRVVWDYSTPEISLFSEEGLRGEQVKLREALKNSQGLEKPLQVASATVSAGLWLLYPKPLFEDTPYILEPGEYPTSEAWGTSDPSVGSLKPMRLGCPSVEKPGEPRAVVYEAPGFQGRSWEVSRDIYNLQQPEDSQSPHLASVGSLRVLGGCWVGYEKEGFRGHQYLLEEGEYPDWSHWGGYDELLTSLRVIRTDFGDPAIVLFEAMDFEGHGVEVSRALPDVELVQHGPSTQAIHVLSGVWVAYQEVGFSGEQYVLEKGVYRNCEDWGAGNSALASLQPVLQVGEHDLHFVSKIQLFSRPDFLGDHFSFEDDQAALPASFRPQSCRVHGGSWILFDEKNFEGGQHILSEGEFPTLTAMGCLASTVLGSLQKVSLHFSEPSIFLYGLQCFEGKEIELSREVRSLQAEGFNNHVLSVRIKGGVWVLCEHSDFRGRQWLVGSCEITNWLTYSGTQRVGSLYPIKQRRVYFRLWNAALGGFLAVPDHVEDMKAGRVVVSDPRAGGSCIWYYEDGLLKNQMAPTMSLQVIGPPSPGSKVVLWAESRLPRQTWSISESGHICSQMFEGQILDVKGGRGYDRDHVVLWEPDEDRASQIWTIHVL
ncbi:beta/gamma crystallin domain-containing protein 2 [Piliocolobus tephrosceles]|uniref:beta/gamma crystallin domain-containing protein 2 n=1 Tax=Piliocolobus tephrosceles TaxID=591936 RepID=UPI000E6AEABA|nr:beta/gamma crystallin domain-containing protein 2 [Piliocolobus tephrosceles]